MTHSLTSKEQAWLKKNSRYFRVAVPSVEDTNSTPDIAFSTGLNAIMLGPRFRADPKDSERRKKKLTHEMIHAHGLPHDGKMRELGYFSSPRRDRFSERVVKDIESGSKRFNLNRINPDDLTERLDDIALELQDLAEELEENPRPKYVVVGSVVLLAALALLSRMRQ